MPNINNNVLTPDQVKVIFDSYKDVRNFSGWKQFRKMNAYTLEINGLVLFRSYFTLVGFVSKGVFYERDKYSMTTTQQVGKYIYEHQLDYIRHFANDRMTTNIIGVDADLYK